jgi:hypothetical protein
MPAPTEIQSLSSAVITFATDRRSARVCSQLSRSKRHMNVGAGPDTYLMPHSVEFAPQFTPTSMRGSLVEWAVAFPTDSGTWQRSDAMPEAEARREADYLLHLLDGGEEVEGW